MSASLRGVGLPPTADALAAYSRRRPAAPGWRGRWERPLTWWSIILLCSSFWYSILHLAGAV